jgi:hypothetical protein
MDPELEAEEDVEPEVELAVEVELALDPEVPERAPELEPLLELACPEEDPERDSCEPEVIEGPELPPLVKPPLVDGDVPHAPMSIGAASSSERRSATIGRVELSPPVRSTHLRAEAATPA